MGVRRYFDVGQRQARPEDGGEFKPTVVVQRLVADGSTGILLYGNLTGTVMPISCWTPFTSSRLNPLIGVNRPTASWEFRAGCVQISKRLTLDLGLRWDHSVG